MNLESIRRKINKQVMEGLTEQEIRLSIMSDEHIRSLSVDKKVEVEQVISDIIGKHNNYKAIQDVLASKILLFNDDKKLVIAFNEATLVKKRIDLVNYKMFINPKLLTDRYYPCMSDYDPHRRECFYVIDGEECFNTYNPPDWLKNHFYFGDDIPLEPEMPEVYKKFFNHLFAGDADSINYVTRWMANSLRAKNNNALTTIGKKGIGKGVFGEILSLLHGKYNSNVLRGTQLGNKFNSVIHRKTFVYIDEVFIQTVEEENNFKMLVNHETQIEGKNQDARTIRNFANLYLSSNQMDSIKVSSDERRFSIVNLTETKLEQSPEFKENTLDKLNELKDPENISALARHLWHLNVDPSTMISHYESAQFRRIREASFKDWEKFFVDEYLPEHAGEELMFREVVKEICEQVDHKFKLNTKHFEQLEDRLKPFLSDQPGKYFFKIQRKRNEKGQQPYKIYVAKKEEMATITIENVEETT